MASLSCARADGVVRSGALPAKLLLCASCCFPTAAPVADGEVQVLACRQHLHRLPRRQDLRRQRPRRRHPQLVGLHQQPRALLAAAPSSASRDLRPLQASFVVRGRVWCDNCRAGFETPASTYIAGAKVRVDCKSKTTGANTCSFEGHTDRTGTYNILVIDEHEHELCESVLVSSPDKGCANVVAGRERAPVFLTSNNGVASNVRLANALGFQKDVALPRCAQILKMYQDEDDRV